MGKPSQRSEKVPAGAIPRAEIPSGAEWEAHCRRVAEARRAWCPPVHVHRKTPRTLPLFPESTPVLIFR